MSTPVVELKGVTKEYINNQRKVVSALHGINLTIHQGEFISIMGPSGSGKTTLANILGLLSMPSAGRVKFLGRKCQHASDDELTELRRKYIGFIFQDYLLIDHMTALQNAMLGMHMSSLSTSKIRSAAINLLAKVGMKKYAHHYPRQLSGGQKQRIAIVRALIKTPRLILADEPAGALDPESRREILGLLQDLNQSGSTIVMVTHNAEDASAGKRLLRVENARIVLDQTIAERSNFGASA